MDPPSASPLTYITHSTVSSTPLQPAMDRATAEHFLSEAGSGGRDDSSSSASLRHTSQMPSSGDEQPDTSVDGEMRVDRGVTSEDDMKKQLLEMASKSEERRRKPTLPNLEPMPHWRSPNSPRALSPETASPSPSSLSPMGERSPTTNLSLTSSPLGSPRPLSPTVGSGFTRHLDSSTLSTDSGPAAVGSRRSLSCVVGSHLDPAASSAQSPLAKDSVPADSPEVTPSESLEALLTTEAVPNVTAKASSLPPPAVTITLTDGDETLTPVESLKQLKAPPTLTLTDDKTAFGSTSKLIHLMSLEGSSSYSSENDLRNLMPLSMEMESSPAASKNDSPPSSGSESSVMSQRSLPTNFKDRDDSPTLLNPKLLEQIVATSLPNLEDQSQAETERCGQTVFSTFLSWLCCLLGWFLQVSPFRGRQSCIS